MTTISLAQIVKIADRLFPFDLAEPWDNCGIQIGDPEKEIRSIAFSLDPTPQTVDFAAHCSCDLLITHHPVLLDPVRNILSDTLAGRTLLCAARSHVDILSLHTNLDAAPGGLNDFVAQKLELEDVTIPLPATCARMGSLAAETAAVELAERVSACLEIPHVRVVLHEHKPIRRVFCASGSGMGYLGEALRHEADVIVTGDVRYHAAREAGEMGLCVIDAGHFGLERFAVQILSESFQREFTSMGLDISCHACPLEKEPFMDIHNR